MDSPGKIAILADAAKYDASCSTSGSARKNTPGGVGNSAVGGICHAWSSDGRCVALLKVLLTNVCAWDCAYCVNRRSSDVRRASFDPDELVRLIMDFYRRNYIEGAFLSSGVPSCPDAAMERLIAVARILRTRERFNGYLHMKAIPGASDELVVEAARWADRVSVNIELPSAASLARLAPDKTPASIFGPMRALARASGFEPRRIVSAARPVPSIGCSTAEPETAEPGFSPPVPTDEPRTAAHGFHPPVPITLAAAEMAPGYGTSTQAFGRPAARASPADGPTACRPSVMEARRGRARNPEAAVLPAGQTTQMVIGASPESDLAILGLAENLYLAYDVRRVYYSAYIPVASDPRIPAVGRPPLLREHRLYQADWLFRFYGFAASEILAPEAPFLDADMDPKCAWALRNLDRFPVDLNRADYLELLRVPGIGPKSAARIVRARREASLKPEGLSALGVVMKRARWFVSCSGRLPDAPGGRRATLPPSSPLGYRRLLSDGMRGVQLEFDWGEPWA